MSYLSDIKLDDQNLPSPTAEIEQERKVAIFDLLEKNTFKLPEKAPKRIGTPLAWPISPQPPPKK